MGQSHSPQEVRKSAVRLQTLETRKPSHESDVLPFTVLVRLLEPLESILAIACSCAGAGYGYRFKVPVVAVHVRLQGDVKIFLPVASWSTQVKSVLKLRRLRCSLLECG